MGAQDLPYDILHNILAHLKALIQPDPISPNKPRLASYACICRSWNEAVEREIFRNLEVVKAEGLARAEELLTKHPSRRLCAVRNLTFVGWYQRSDSLKRDLSRKQLAERDAAFSADVERLLRLLTAVERAGDARLALELRFVLEKTPPEDGDEEGVEGFDNGDDDDDNDDDSEFDDYGSGGDDEERLKYDPAYLRYVGEGLPQVHCVKQFILQRSQHERLWGASVTTLLSAMEGLELCNVSFHDEQTVDPGVRIDYRKALGESLYQIPDTCKRFYASFEHCITEAPKSQPGFVPNSVDSLCLGLQSLSTQLVNISLEMLTISPALFWPQGEGDVATAPHWPNLEYFYIRYSPISASGEPFAHSDPDRPNQELTNGLFVAVGKAVRNMPALQIMDLEMAPELDFQVLFSYVFDKADGVFQAKWSGTGETLKLSPDVLRAFNIKEEDLVLNAPREPPKKKKRWEVAVFKSWDITARVRNQ
ncbi:hypothetical protein DIS24_g11506 [Lasiodiplodia hormozganensis]|uniref:F-box domain-containing protein n=1 Tax=Lasiodiplodia hormozganensis TaxID=869390 RepID=A0AA39WNX9_9PEZI|nr:hypothetical protein DIS24_g11506 [Lasiodiplodia hormozganensis]